MLSTKRSARAPSKVYLCGRDPAHDIVLEAARVYFSNFDEGIMLVDPRTGDYREPSIADVAQVARLVDALPNIDTYESAVGAQDVPMETSSLYKWEAAIHNTGKPVGSEATSAWDVRKVIEMAAVVAGGEDASAAGRRWASGCARSARSSCRATPRK